MKFLHFTDTQRAEANRHAESRRIPAASKVWDLPRTLSAVASEFPHESQQGGCRNGYQTNLWILKTLYMIPQVRSGPVKVLDVGAGSGVVSQCLAMMGHSVCAIDTWAEYASEFHNNLGVDSDIVNRMSAKGVRCVRSDIVRDPWPVSQRAFDVAILAEVIEHIPESPRRLLNSIWASLKPGGTLLITTPNHARLIKRVALLFGRSAHSNFDVWWNTTPFFGHIREYTTDEVQKMMRGVGFEEVRARVSNRPMWHGIYDKSLLQQLAVFSYLSVSTVLPGWRTALDARTSLRSCLSFGKAGECLSTSSSCARRRLKRSGGKVGQRRRRNERS
jgi:2-polyprenyl-3-methyl-5-hydroxy-6-metoxy-1,4-benzoquinol methylase